MIPENFDLKKSLRLYAVTDRAWLRDMTLAEQVEEAILGGVTFVQLREKEADEEEFLQLALQVKDVCAKYRVPFVINDNVELAVKVDADGVHVGQDDMNAMNVRELIGPGKILGVTAKTFEQVDAAIAAGADYLGSGAVFGSATKTNAKPMDHDTFASICAHSSIPVVAIGGINASNLLQLKSTGLCGAAVVSGIFAADDIRKESEKLRTMIDSIVE